MPGPVRILTRRLVVWGATLLVVLDAWQQASESIRVRALVGACIPLAGASIWQIRRLQSSSDRLWHWCGLAFGATLAALGTPLVLGARGSAPILLIAHALITATAGWALVSGVLSAAPETADATSPDPLAPVLVLASGVVAVLVVSFFYMGHGRPVLVDELLYRLESRLAFRTASPMTFPPSDAGFFALRQSFVTPAGLFPQYPPGWPWLIAMFRSIGLETWAPELLSGAVVIATALLARRVTGPSTPFAAAAFLAASPEFLFDGSVHYAHAASALCLVLAALAIAPGDAPVRSSVRWALFGAAVGMAVLIRPLTGVTVGFSVALWGSWRPDAGPMAKRGLVAAAAALPFVIALLWFQQTTTGHAFESGYVAANGALHNLGFGQRGFVSWQVSGMPHPVARDFGWREALVALASRLWDSGFAATAGAVAAPLMAFAVARKPRIAMHWGVVAMFLALPLTHTFYFYSKARFYTDLLPFMGIGLAYLVDRLDIRGWRRRTMLAAVLVAGLGIHAERVWTIHRANSHNLRLYDAVARMAQRCGPILVFATDTPRNPYDRSEPHFESLYWYNVEQFGGRVLVARDLGAADTTLQAQVPRRTAFVAAGAADSLLRPLSASAPACLNQVTMRFTSELAYGRSPWPV